MLSATAGLGLTGLVAACTSNDAPTPSASSPGTASGSVPTGPSAPSSPTNAPAWATLSSRLQRPLLRPGAAAFGSAARLYNPRFDSLAAPAAIARCASTDDVAECVRFAAESGVPLAVRAGGHSYGGWSTGRGLVADVRGLSSVQVDTASGLAHIGAGAQLADVYTALAARNVALVGGSCPTVGFTGLALGGGVGVLTRAYGLTCDAVRSVQAVTADGEVRTVDAAHDTDLFWALRGGGGGFAAVTSLTVAVRAAPTVTRFFLEFDFAHAADVLSAWQSWIPSMPPALWSTCKLLADPADASLHATVSGTWIGAAGQLGRQLAPLLAQLPAPTGQDTTTETYGTAMMSEAGCAGQSATTCTLQALQPPKRQPFAASSSIMAGALPSVGVAAAVGATTRALNVPGLVEGGVSFDSLGGAVAAVAPSATAFPHRTALASVQYTATWGATAPAGPTAAAPFDAYVRAFRATMTPWLGAAAYVNYADASIADYGTAYWGDNYPRLRQIKAHYDPDGLFSFAQSVRP